MILDIIVTTPKSQMANAAQEAADCLRDGGGEYFRRFAIGQAPNVEPGDRVYYVEDGYIRGFAVVRDTQRMEDGGMTCDTTRRSWPPGFYVFMRADSWQWIAKIPWPGFQGFRYARYRYGGQFTREWLLVKDRRPIGLGDHPNAGAMLDYAVCVVGNWRDPKPRVTA
jgi:hypothetical protein